MKATGIIVEYNPIHNGHLFHIVQARQKTQCDVLVAVMSGNYVQRGEPALFDKFKRAEAALRQGVDLVIELPYAYATQAASHFAQGAIELLNLAKVDALVFGSESDNLEELTEIAHAPIAIDHIKESMKTGMSFVRAYGLLASAMEPNDILGVAYLKALQNTKIQPMTIQRTVHYHDPDFYGNVASASAIRRAIKENQDVKDVIAMETDFPQVQLEQFYPEIKMLLNTMSLEDLRSIFLFSEGIEQHLIQCSRQAEDLKQFIQLATTRRYTRSRIQRCCLHLLNQVKTTDVKQLPPLDTLRILGFNETGRTYLKQLKKQGVKIASRFAQVPEAYRKMELKTTRLYGLHLPYEKQQELIEKEIGGAIYIK